MTLHSGDRVVRVNRPPVRGRVCSVQEPELSFFGAQIVFVEWDDGGVSNLMSFELRKLSYLELLAEATE